MAAQQDSGSEAGQAHGAWAARVEQAVDAGAQPGHAGQHQHPGDPPRRRGGRARAAVAAGVHRRGEPQGTIQGVVQDRERDRPQRPQPSGLAARSRRARATRCTLSTSCGATDSATVTATPSSYSAPGSTCSARLGLARVLAAPMQHSRQASRSPSMAAGKRRLQRHRTADLDARVPVAAWAGAAAGTGCVVGGDAGGEHRPEHHPDRDDDQGHDQVVLEGPRPGRVGAPGRDDEAEHAEDQSQQQRVAGPAGRGRQRDRPQPPRHRDAAPWAVERKRPT